MPKDNGVNRLQPDSKNPFLVSTPEDISAQMAKDLFVDAFTDFAKVKHTGHTFLNGHRGSGKSMMFRYLLPDCQALVKNCAVADLDFFAIYIPIKKTNLRLTDLERLKDQNANVLLNEHFLCLYAATKIFEAVASVDGLDTPEVTTALSTFARTSLKKTLLQNGLAEGDIPAQFSTHVGKELAREIANFCESQFAEVLNYLKRIALNGNYEYTGPVYGYMDFLYPLLVKIKELPVFPKGPIFLLFDDADNLSRIQTMILNSWVSMRTTQNVSLKISTQLRYKTFKSVSGQTIETPHDYYEVNISEVYTTLKSKYYNRIQSIVQRRLKLAGIESDPHDFFPPDFEQEQRIQEIGVKIRADWETDGRGYRPSDDVGRYARPNFIASLKGTSKSGSTYSYAGLDQLIHLSSGLIRYFLEPASMMFDMQLAQSSGTRITKISPSIQNQVVRDQADYMMFSEFEKLSSDEELDSPGRLRIQKLGNLINALGNTFHQILLSGRSERRVISFAISGSPDDELVAVLRLGVEYGYFHESSIGNKDGTGRTKLYILTRRLAPHFLLDPSGFAGYLFLTPQILNEGMTSPSRLLREMKRDGVVEYFKSNQLSLFEED